MLGERLARRALAGEGRHCRGLGHRHLGRDLVFGRRALQFLELQLDLIEKARPAFRARTIEFARQFLDPQLLVSYQGLIIRGLGLATASSASAYAALAASMMCLSRAAASAAVSAAMSFGKASPPESMC